MIQKRSWSLSTKIIRHFYNMVKILVSRPKKSLVSGNWPGDKFFYLLPACIGQMCMRVDIFCFKKTHINKKISTSKFIGTNLRFFPFKQ